MIVFAVVIGGACGAPARYLAERFIAARNRFSVPWGTVVVNISGSLLLGVLTGLDLNGHLGTGEMALLATGFCGAYTTFSAWSFESVSLLEAGQYRSAVVNIVGSLVLGLAAGSAGLAIGLVT